LSSRTSTAADWSTISLATGAVAILALFGSSLFVDSREFLVESWDRRCESCQLLLVNMWATRDAVWEELGKERIGIDDVYAAQCDEKRFEHLASQGVIKFGDNFAVHANPSERSSAERNFLARTRALCKHTMNMETTHPLLEDLRLTMEDRLTKVDRRFSNPWDSLKYVYLEQGCVVQSEICGSNSTLHKKFFDWDHFNVEYNKEKRAALAAAQKEAQEKAETAANFEAAMKNGGGTILA